ncbi:hypothetical protein WDW89_12170 [Deltaproteobacteria bacterium TL4]
MNLDVDVEELLKQLYEKSIRVVRTLKKVDTQQVTEISRIILVELFHTWISWIILIGEVVYNFAEVLALQAIYSWFAPFKSTMTE